jgi:predicted dehydrogenase
MSQRVCLAVIGTGHWGPNLIRNFYEDPRVDLRVICDVDRNRAKAIASRFRDLGSTTEVDDIINDPTIDAVVICTPTETHYELARRCLMAGKHLFVEKPMAKTSAECEELIEIAREKNLKLMVGHVFLYNTAVQYIKGLIDRDELGDIIYIHGKRVNLGPIRKDVNALWDLAPHDIAILNYWLGCEPRAVNATGVQHITPSLHDVVFASLKYPNNVFASLHISWLDPRKVRQITVVGTKRMVVFDDLDPVGPIHIYDKTVTKQKPTITDTIQAFKAIVQEGDLVIPKLGLSEPLKNECAHFIQWLTQGVAPLSTGSNGLCVVKVLEALTTSLNQAGVEISVQTRSQRSQPSQSICQALT